MKKLLLLFLALATLVTLAACDTGEAPHTHSFAADWTSDATDHWHACSGTGCKDIDSKAAHTFTSAGVTQGTSGATAGLEKFTCSVCGYAKTEPFNAATQEEWDALFAYENLKMAVKCTVAEATQEYTILINGEVVQLTMGEMTGFADRNEVLATTDFSNNYAAFSTTDKVTYTASTVTMSGQTFTNVIITLADGKIATISYDTVENEENCSYVFTCSDWGTITIATPTVSAAQWANAISDVTLSNYSVDVYTTKGSSTKTEYYQFLGNSYYYCLGENESINTQANAGKTVLSEIAKLLELQADKFEYSAIGFAYAWETDAFAYTEPVLKFKGDLAAVAIFLCFNEDGQIDEMIVNLSDGTQILYYFHTYGNTTPGNPSYAQGQLPEVPPVDIPEETPGETPEETPGDIPEPD